MSDLLNIGRAAIRANSRALEVVGSNVANAENPDYVRRSVTTSDTTIYGANNPIYSNYTRSGSVTVDGITRASDQFLENFSVPLKNSQQFRLNQRCAVNLWEIFKIPFIASTKPLSICHPRTI